MPHIDGPVAAPAGPVAVAVAVTVADNSTGNGIDDEQQPLLTHLEDDLADDPAPPSASPAPAPRAIRPPRRAFVLIALFAGIFLSSLDNTIVAALYTLIGTDFRASDRAGWIVTAYMLCNTAFQPIYGQLADALGRRTAFLAGMTLFTVGSACCGVAPSMPALVLSRALAGIGGGGVLTTATIIMSDLVPLRQRGQLQGFGNVVYGAASLVGGPLGGYLADVASWRWAFYLHLPIAVPAILMGAWAIPDEATTSRPPSPSPPLSSSSAAAASEVSHERWRWVLLTPLRWWKPRQRWQAATMQFDTLGAVVLISAMTLLVLGLSAAAHGVTVVPDPASGGETAPWTIVLPWRTASVGGTLALGAALLAAFAWIETTVATAPLLPPRLWRQPTAVAALLANGFGSAAALASVFLVPVYFQVGHGVSAARAGLRLVPKVLGASAGSLGAGWVLAQTGDFCRPTWFGGFAMVVGDVWLMRTWRPVPRGVAPLERDASWQIPMLSWRDTTLPLVLHGIGYGCILTTLLIAMLASVQAHQQQQPPRQQRPVASITPATTDVERQLPGETQSNSARAARDDTAVASAATYLFRSCGALVGVAVTQMWVQATLLGKLAAPEAAVFNPPSGPLPPHQMARVLDVLQNHLSDLQMPGTLPLPDAAVDRTVIAYLAAVMAAWRWCLGASVLAFLSSLLLRPHPLAASHAPSQTSTSADDE